MVGPVGENWLQKNDGRDYPFVDGADAVIPTNLIVDTHISFLPSTGPTSKVFFSQLQITKARCVLEVSVEGQGPILSLDVERPFAYRNYSLVSVGIETAHGFVCFGSAVDTGAVSFNGEDLTADDAYVLESCVVRLESPVFNSVMVGDSRVSGDVTLRGEGGINVVVKGGLICFELDNTLSALEEPLRDCQIPLESGKIPDGEAWPFLSMNGVYPDVDGEIAFEIHSQLCGLVEFSIDGNALMVESQQDYSQFCGSKVRKEVTDYGVGCADCSYTVEIDSGDMKFFVPHQAFIHRGWLVVKWGYGGESEGVPMSPTVTLGEGLSASFVPGDSKHARPIVLVYDRVENEDLCDPDGPEAELPEAGVLVFALNKVVRNMAARISFEITEGSMKDDEDNEAPGFSMGCVTIRDPFVFDTDYMPAGEQAVIEAEIAAYRNGNPPWGS